MLRADLDKLGLGPKTAEQTAIDEANTRRRIEEKEAFLERKFPDPNAEYSRDVAAKRAILKDRKDSDFWTTILGAGLRGASEAKSTPGMAGVIQSLSGTGANAVEGIQKLANEREKRDDLLMQAQQQMAQANQARKLGFLDRANAYEAASQAAATAAKTQGIQLAQMLSTVGMSEKMLANAAEQLKIARIQAAKPDSQTAFLTTLSNNPKLMGVYQQMQAGKSRDDIYRAAYIKAEDKNKTMLDSSTHEDPNKAAEEAVRRYENISASMGSSDAPRFSLPPK